VIAALYVDPRGPYAGLPDVDLWDEARDARLYQGPHPVVAHPPCSRWCQLAAIVEKRYGYKRGDAGGCFAAALTTVRRTGGVLEHPAYSKAWPAFNLPAPPTKGGWVRGMCGGWSCHVEQGHFGHPARKATWLYAFGATFLPGLPWGRSSAVAVVSWCKNHGGGHGPRIGKKAASATPPGFRDILLTIARSVPR
jgi:hypothetical protein